MACLLHRTCRRRSGFIADDSGAATARTGEDFR
jgi:hypothetical protein